uniref:claspin-like n=1 Tax=Myxine glutinosa TaxID=7769 RepID=UPI00358E5939
MALRPCSPSLVENVVDQLKSQGMFDQFRRDCLADVDTRPAYQNLRRRVESFVDHHLGSITWNPNLSKNLLRNQLRQTIIQSGVLDPGVDRIVHQVVIPKINCIFRPQVEKVVQDFLGLTQPNGGSDFPPEWKSNGMEHQHDVSMTVASNLGAQCDELRGTDNGVMSLRTKLHGNTSTMDDATSIMEYTTGEGRGNPLADILHHETLPKADEGIVIEVAKERHGGTSSYLAMPPMRLGSESSREIAMVTESEESRQNNAMEKRTSMSPSSVFTCGTLVADGINTVLTVPPEGEKVGSGKWGVSGPGPCSTSPMEVRKSDIAKGEHHQSSRNVADSGQVNISAFSSKASLGGKRERSSSFQLSCPPLPGKKSECSRTGFHDRGVEQVLATASLKSFMETGYGNGSTEKGITSSDSAEANERFVGELPVKHSDLREVKDNVKGSSTCDALFTGTMSRSVDLKDVSSFPKVKSFDRSARQRRKDKNAKDKVRERERKGMDRRHLTWVQERKLGETMGLGKDNVDKNGTEDKKQHVETNLRCEEESGQALIKIKSMAKENLKMAYVLQDSDFEGLSDIAVSSVHTSDLSSFEDMTSTSEDESTDTVDSKADTSKMSRVPYVHKPFLYSKYYSDSDDEETVEKRRQRIAIEKEERLLKRQRNREKLDDKLKHSTTQERIESSTNTDMGASVDEPQIGAVHTPSVKETLKEQKALEKKMAYRQKYKKRRIIEESTSQSEGQRRKSEHFESADHIKTDKNTKRSRLEEPPASSDTKKEAQPEPIKHKERNIKKSKCFSYPPCRSRSSSSEEKSDITVKKGEHTQVKNKQRSSLEPSMTSSLVGKHEETRVKVGKVVTKRSDKDRKIQSSKFESRASVSSDQKCKNEKSSKRSIKVKEGKSEKKGIESCSSQKECQAESKKEMGKDNERKDFLFKGRKIEEHLKKETPERDIIRDSGKRDEVEDKRTFRKNEKSRDIPAARASQLSLKDEKIITKFAKKQLETMLKSASSSCDAEEVVDTKLGELKQIETDFKRYPKESSKKHNYRALQQESKEQRHIDSGIGTQNETKTDSEDDNKSAKEDVLSITKGEETTRRKTCEKIAIDDSHPVATDDLSNISSVLSDPCSITESIEESNICLTRESDDAFSVFENCQKEPSSKAFENKPDCKFTEMDSCHSHVGVNVEKIQHASLSSKDIEYPGTNRNNQGDTKRIEVGDERRDFVNPKEMSHHLNKPNPSAYQLKTTDVEKVKPELKECQMLCEDSSFSDKQETSQLCTFDSSESNVAAKSTGENESVSLLTSKPCNDMDKVEDEIDSVVLKRLDKEFYHDVNPQKQEIPLSSSQAGMKTIEESPDIKGSDSSLNPDTIIETNVLSVETNYRGISDDEKQLLSLRAPGVAEAASKKPCLKSEAVKEAKQFVSGALDSIENKVDGSFLKDHSVSEVTSTAFSIVPQIKEEYFVPNEERSTQEHLSDTICIPNVSKEIIQKSASKGSISSPMDAHAEEPGCLDIQAQKDVDEPDGPAAATNSEADASDVGNDGQCLSIQEANETFSDEANTTGIKLQEGPTQHGVNQKKMYSESDYGSDTPELNISIGIHTSQDEYQKRPNTRQSMRKGAVDAKGVPVKAGQMLDSSCTTVPTDCCTHQIASFQSATNKNSSLTFGLHPASLSLQSGKGQVAVDSSQQLSASTAGHLSKQLISLQSVTQYCMRKRPSLSKIDEMEPVYKSTCSSAESRDTLEMKENSSSSAMLESSAEPDCSEQLKLQARCDVQSVLACSIDVANDKSLGKEVQRYPTLNKPVDEDKKKKLLIVPDDQEMLPSTVSGTTEKSEGRSEEKSEFECGTLSKPFDELQEQGAAPVGDIDLTEITYLTKVADTDKCDVHELHHHKQKLEQVASSTGEQSKKVISSQTEVAIDEPECRAGTGFPNQFSDVAQIKHESPDSRRITNPKSRNTKEDDGVTHLDKDIASVSPVSYTHTESAQKITDDVSFPLEVAPVKRHTRSSQETTPVIPCTLKSKQRRVSSPVPSDAAASGRQTRSASIKANELAKTARNTRSTTASSLDRATTRSGSSVKHSKERNPSRSGAETRGLKRASESQESSGRRSGRVSIPPPKKRRR